MYWTGRLLSIICLLAPLSSSQQACLSTVDLDPTYMKFSDDSCWWQCIDDDATGVFCKDVCSNSTLQCARNEYEQACDVPFQPYCRRCAHETSLDFKEGEGKVLPMSENPAILRDANGEWSTDILQGAGTFENAKLRTLDVANTVSFIDSINISLSKDVFFLQNKWSTRDKNNSWYGRGEVLLSGVGTNAKRAAADTAVSIQMFSSSELYRLIPNAFFHKDGNAPYRVVSDYIISFQWARQSTYNTNNQFMFSMYKEGIIPPTTAARYSDLYVVPSTVLDTDWKSVHLLLADVGEDNQEPYVMEITMDGNSEINLDEIKLTPNFVQAGDMERNPTYSNLAYGTDLGITAWKNLNEHQAERKLYSNGFGSLPVKALGYFLPKLWFMWVPGSNTVGVPGGIIATPLETATHIVQGSWATLRLWVMPIQDPALSALPSKFRARILSDKGMYEYAKTQILVIRQTLTEHKWHVFETTFPIVSEKEVAFYIHQADSYSVNNEEFLIEVVSGPDLAFDNIEVSIHDGVCPYECTTVGNYYMPINGRCELCSPTVKCAVDQLTIGCSTVTSQDNFPNCNPCSESQLGARVEANGGYVRNTAQECWFECQEEYWYNETGRACQACTPVQDMWCDVGMYVKACSSRSDTYCEHCSTLSEYSSSVLYTPQINRSSSRLTSPESKQCVAQCADGYFEWLHMEQTSVGTVSDPLCFPCTTTVCGALADGSDARRSRVGLQYTTECTAATDSTCETCDSVMYDGEGGVLVSSGTAVGEFCVYECVPGFFICKQCKFYAMGDVGVDVS
ncbi:hypothetical protein T484DRAFT_1757940, partial [Baffinella frigidus]